MVYVDGRRRGASAATCFLAENKVTGEIEMPYVLLTADARYGNSPRFDAREREGQVALLAENERWAAQVDAADIGGPHEVVRIDLPRGTSRRLQQLLRDTDAVLAATVAGWQRAAQLAGHGGTIGVLVGHGSSGRTSHGTQTAVFADLAPGEFLRVTVHLMQLYGEAVANDGRMTPEYTALRAIEDAIRSNRVQRVDLLTCNLGAGGGSLLTGLLSRRWGARVRGLMGYLHSEQVTESHAGTRRRWVEMYVRRERHYPTDGDHAFIDRIPDESFWD